MNIFAWLLLLLLVFLLYCILIPNALTKWRRGLFIFPNCLFLFYVEENRRIWLWILCFEENLGQNVCMYVCMSVCMYLVSRPLLRLRARCQRLTSVLRSNDCVCISFWTTNTFLIRLMFNKKVCLFIIKQIEKERRRKNLESIFRKCL